MMNRYLGAVALALALAIPAAAQERIAVLDTELPKGVDPKVVIPITEKIMEEFVRSKLFTVLDRAFINKTLSELEFSTSDLTAGDSDKLATIGGFLKATYIVVSTVQQLDRTYFLSAKMIEVKTGVITAQASVNEEGSLAVLIDMAGNLGRKLVAAAMGQESIASSRPSGRLGAPETTAPPSVPEASPPEPEDAPPPREASKPPRDRFSVICLDAGAAATMGYTSETGYNFFDGVLGSTEAVSGSSYGLSATFPLGLLYLSGFGSMTKSEYLERNPTATGETLSIGAGLGLNLPLGPIQAYAGIRAAHMAFSILFEDTNTWETLTYDFSGPGFGFELGADIRLGWLALGLRYAMDSGTLSPDDESLNLQDAMVGAGALSLRAGLAF